jgi:hypothetical protein
VVHGTEWGGYTQIRWSNRIIQESNLLDIFLLLIDELRKKVPIPFLLKMVEDSFFARRNSEKEGIPNSEILGL